MPYAIWGWGLGNHGLLIHVIKCNCCDIFTQGHTGTPQCHLPSYTVCHTHAITYRNSITPSTTLVIQACTSTVSCPLKVTVTMTPHYINVTLATEVP